VTPKSAKQRRYDPVVGLLTLGALTATVVALMRVAPLGATVGILTGAAGLYWLYNAERNRHRVKPRRGDR